MAGKSAGQKIASTMHAKRGRSAPRVKVKVIIHESEDGGYWAQVPALPGCVTQAKTLQELYANIREAVGGILLSTSGTFEPEPGGKTVEIPL